MADYYRMEPADVLAAFDVKAETGLSSDAARQRQAEHGKNELPKDEGTTLLRLFINQFVDLMVIILLGAAVISFFLGEYTDVGVILVIAILNAALGTYQEYRAEQALAALSAMQVPQVRVRRDGTIKEISAEDIVPGDIVLLGEGDSIPADGRLIEAANLQTEEAALTGESAPEGKHVATVTSDEDIAVADQENMVFRGTSVNYGRGEFVVTAIGLKTEIGKIAEMLLGVEEGETPLQRRVNQLARYLVAGAFAVIVLVFGVGLWRGVPLEEMLITSIGLAVAAVPEGLPALITISLSLGASRMVRRHALIRRLPAVETLGSVTVICSDKTGTLTKNEMTTTHLALPGHDDVEVTGIGYQAHEGEFREGDQTLDPHEDRAVGRFLKAMALSTDAYLEPAEEEGMFNVVGDTTEGALLVAARKADWSRDKLEQSLPRVAELPFSSERKAMTTIHEVRVDEADELFTDTPYLSITKGAPDRLIDWATHEHMPDGPVELTDERRETWSKQVDAMAGQGLRVLGVAYRGLDQVPDEVTPDIERDLRLLGLIGILDPARPEAREAVETARRAGIRSIMITGDHALTAEAIARDLGIIEEGQKAITGVQIDKLSDDELDETVRTTSAFARVSPEHKMRLVKALQKQDQITAMTGDGVNDAPALKQADIGVAMGITGTEVSKGAADMVLTDDNFASIVAAVEEGRIIYDNIRKFVRYMLSSNVGEILVMFVALLLGWPLPLIAIQILWINLVTDGLPAIGLGFERGEADIMKRRPRDPNESIFAGGVGVRVVWMSIVLAALSLGSYVWSYSHQNLQINQPTLGLETFDAAGLAELVSDDLVPPDWDSLSEAERRDLLTDGGAGDNGAFAEGGSSSEILNAAERLPRTVAFTVLALGQIFHVLAIHAGDRTSFFRKWFRENQFMLWAVLSTFALQFAVVYVPFLNDIFDTVPLNVTELLVVIGFASLILFITEIEKIVGGPLTERPEQTATEAA